MYANELVLHMANLLASVVPSEHAESKWFHEHRDHLATLAGAYLMNERMFVAVGVYSWGAGRTKEEALANMVKNGGKRTHYILYDAPLGTSVNEMGGLNYPNAYATLGIEKPREIERKAPKARKTAAR